MANMAKYIGLLTSDARGKLGGVVLTRARNGTNLKAGGVPGNIGTALQSTQRARLAGSLWAWRQLTGPQRVSWGSVAAALTWSNSLAQTFTPSGLQLWTQAYINAAAMETTPPGTCSGSPGSVPAITNVGIFGSPSYGYNVIANVDGSFTGAWLLYMSRVIPASLNYTRTISRRLIGYSMGGNVINLEYGWPAAYGDFPAVGSISNVRAVPVDKTCFFSGTQYIANTVFQS